jgi:acyl carrier protein phosphodiesterase
MIDEAVRGTYSLATMRYVLRQMSEDVPKYRRIKTLRPYMHDVRIIRSEFRRIAALTLCLVSDHPVHKHGHQSWGGNWMD